jgi:hypothetical protein
VKQKFLTPLAAVTAVVAGCIGLLGPVAAATAGAPSPSPSPSPSKKDPCGVTKSKWAHIQCMEYTSSAPGDEYFGKLKMSYLGIDNTFKDGSISAGAYTTDQHVISKLVFADDALQRWAAKYPGDPQLPRSYFLGVQVFRKVYTQPGQQIAWEYIQALVHKYPNTYFGKTMKASLAHNGYTEHWFALPQLCPTPLPAGVMPENTPSATATPSPAPGQPNIDVITPPCVEPSPLPEPTETPSPLPKGAKSRSPLPEPTNTPAPLPEVSVAPSPSATPQHE